MSPSTCVGDMTIQLSESQFDVFFKLLGGTPLGRSTTISFCLSQSTLELKTLGDLCALDTTLRAALILGYRAEFLDQLQSLIDQEALAFGKTLPRAV